MTPLIKFAVVSDAVPPSLSGQAVMLYRLLVGVPGDRYCLISTVAPASITETGSVPKLPAAHYGLRPPAYYTRSAGAQATVSATSSKVARQRKATSPSAVKGLLSFIPSILLRASRIAAIIKREGCQAVIGCSGEAMLFPASYIAASWSRVPFYAYMFDDYVHQWPAPPLSYWVARVGPWILRKSAGVIVPNEFLQNEYERCYGVTSVVIHNPCSLDGYSNGEGKDQLTYGEDIAIVYTGAIYVAQYDALRRLADALQRLPCPRVCLHLYSGNSEQEIAQHGIEGPIVHHGALSHTEIENVQRHAHILFLPLAFRSPYPQVIRTSAPGKMGDYLATGRPVLVHAPADSFVSWYFRQHECGLVVDRDDVDELASAIQRLVADGDLRRRLGAKARARALADFDPRVAQARLLSLFTSGASAT